MPAFLRANGTVSAFCPDCGATANFDLRHFLVIGKGPTINHKTYTRGAYALLQCSGCQRGGLATICDDGGWESACLLDFFPFSQEKLTLPAGIPEGIVKEFREAEMCASIKAYRAASAMLRSALEKVLKENGYEDLKNSGYDKMKLQKKIDEAAADGIITESLKIRAHNELRVLGNDVMHDDWKEVTENDFLAAHKYTQRILEAFYDHRESVEGILLTKKRTQPQQPPATAVPNTN